MSNYSSSTFPPRFSTNNRLAIHNKREDFLNNLAIILGCYESFGSELPDGKRPDVIRFNSSKRILFIGDAKHTETPNNGACRKRLMNYLLWFSSHLSKVGRVGIFAICFGNRSDLIGWIETIKILAQLAGIVISELYFEEFDHRTKLLWFVCR